MTKHSTYVTHIIQKNTAPMTHQARCTCGWRDKENSSMDDADKAAREHGPLMVPDYRPPKALWEK